MFDNELTIVEKACFMALRRDEEWDPGYFYSNIDPDYQKYCNMCKRAIAHYVKPFNLSNESINRIFEHYFMIKG